MKKVFYLIFLFSFISFSQKKMSVKSPNGEIEFQFELKKDAPYYKVKFGNQLLIDESPLGLVFKGAELQKNLKLGKPEYNEVDTTYKLVVGKTSEARDHHNEMILPFTGKDQKKFNIVVRVFNDGVGFRYEFPEQIWKSYELVDEKTSFNIAGNPTVYSMFWGSYDTSHEALYHIMPFKEIPKDTLMDMPGMFNFSDKAYLSITEANLRDYAGMYLKKKDGYLETQLSPLPGQDEIKVKAELPHHTPWRVILIGDRVGTLIESNIITSLNEPSKIDDTSWIKPGKTSFHWWNGDIVPDTTFAPGINFKTNKYYIDFCAKHNIPYHAVIGYGGIAWYKSDASGFSVIGPNTDLTKPVASLEMQRICDYAKDKGVSINVWVHWEALYPQLEEAFAQFEKWGIKGLMVDFINRDDQEMVNIMEEILESAARHKLYIQFHGSFKSTGLHRTYPNELTREGTYNYEQNKWQKKPISPEHDLNVVFTRMLAGSSDYHLGGFRAVLPENFKIQYTRPLMTGTRSHMMAMYVVLESYLSMVADYPEAYEGEPGFDFVSEVPTIWDETVVPEAKLESHVVIARRKGDNWYVGSLNNSEKKSVSFTFDFLKKGQSYQATIYSDDAKTNSNPNHIKIEEKTFQKGDKFEFQMASGGGLVIKLEPVN
jgi:alpha-glucosidase